MKCSVYNAIGFSFPNFHTDFDNKQQAKIVVVIGKYERIVFVYMWYNNLPISDKMDDDMLILQDAITICCEEIITEDLVRRMVIMFGLPLEDWSDKSLRYILNNSTIYCQRINLHQSSGTDSFSRPDARFSNKKSWFIWITN